MQPNSPVLTIDGQPIVVPQVFAYLQSSGKLQGFVTEILRQHVIAQEFKTRQGMYQCREIRRELGQGRLVIGDFS